MINITQELGMVLQSRRDEIENWFLENYKLLPKNKPPLFYSSVDIRRSRFKLAPVDSNLFPAGFNNLSTDAKERGAAAAKEYFRKYYPHAKKILILAEGHTRNLYYLENILALKDLLRETGMEVMAGGLGLDSQSLSLKSASGKEVTMNFIRTENNKIVAGEKKFTADVILLNNDLTAGPLAGFDNISQAVIPDPSLGWYQRKKSTHFSNYDDVAKKFGSHFGIEPFLITTVFENCGMVNFKESEGLECVAIGVEKVLYNLRARYKEFGISDEPYVFIKSDKGTYGMGIMTASSGDAVYDMGKKLRNKMNVIKGGEINDQVIIQEGIPTIDSIGNHPAEPVLYVINHTPIGIFYRGNNEKSEFGNLNSSGMKFYPDLTKSPGNDNAELHPCGFHIFGLIARLASLAAAKEEY